ncbi:MAG: hypothetical protein IJA97_01410 [Clostridia bacterium]|nr:hypothetical protein [Clostridia bacterium]
MTVLEIITKALKILGDENLLSYVLGQNDQLLAYREDKELLLLAYNQTSRSVGAYFPLSKVESFSVVDGAVSYEKFSFNPYKIVSVKGTKGAVDYEIFPTEIRASNDITVEYNYFPEAEDYSDAYAFAGVVPCVDFCYGILAEYLLFKGRYSESATYFDKFINALSVYSRSKKRSHLPAREWF